jgi:2,4-dienoyl-CoA reductase-like NADH-dependent reductase (Old Yellow Enzyme family)
LIHNKLLYTAYYYFLFSVLSELFLSSKKGINLFLRSILLKVGGFLLVDQKIWENTVLQKLELPGGKVASNRIWRSATWMGMGNPDGSINDALIDVYSKIKAGVVVTGFQYVMLEGKLIPGMISNSGPEVLPGMKKLADAIHSSGSLAGAQLVHCGGVASPLWWGGDAAYGPSDAEVPLPTGDTNTVKAMTVEQVEQATVAYADAAKRAVEAGFDVIELHGAHNFQLWQFFDPVWNKRPSDDPYTGTTLEGRSKAMVDTVSAVKAAVEVPIFVKVDSSSPATKPEEVGELANKIAEAGACGIIMSGPDPTRLQKAGEAYFLEDAMKIKSVAKNSGLFFGLVGGIRSPEIVIKTLTGNGDSAAKFDVLQLSRPFVTEPALLDRWLEEAKRDDLTPARCISCNKCFESGLAGEGVRCKVFED